MTSGRTTSRKEEGGEKRILVVSQFGFLASPRFVSPVLLSKRAGGQRGIPSGRKAFVLSYRVAGRKRLATLGEGVVWGATGACVVENFPSPGEAVALTWQQNSQHFVLTAVG